MSFWGKIFGTDEAIKETIGAVRDGLDALVYTDEEKAQDAAKERAEARSMVVEWMAATSGQNLARRIISLAITGVWLMQYVGASLAGGVAIFWTSQAAKLNELQVLMSASAEGMQGAVMLILAFYFAAPHMGAFAEAIISKWKGKVNASKPKDDAGNEETLRQ